MHATAEGLVPTLDAAPRHDLIDEQWALLAPLLPKPALRRRRGDGRCVGSSMGSGSGSGSDARGATCPHGTAPGGGSTRCSRVCSCPGSGRGSRRCSPRRACQGRLAGLGQRHHGPRARVCRRRAARRQHTHHRRTRRPRAGPLARWLVDQDPPGLRPASTRVGLSPHTRPDPGTLPR